MKFVMRAALTAAAVTVAVPSYAATVVSTSAVDFSVNLLLGAQQNDNAATRDQDATPKSGSGSFSGLGANKASVSGTFKGGTILGVGIDVSEESYLDLETEAAGAFARD